jgi:hypothetical protein
MVASEASDFAHILGVDERLEYTTRWSKLPLIGWNLFAVPIGLLGVAMLFDPTVRGIGFAFAATAAFISASAYAAWAGRAVIVTNRRIIYLTPFTKSSSFVPLDKIEHIRQATGKVTVRTGAAQTKLTLSVPDAESLAAAIEAARANMSTMPQPAGLMPELGTVKKKEPTQAEKVLGFVMLGVIAAGVVLYNLPEPEGRGSAHDRVVPPPVVSAEPKSSPSARIAPSNPMTGPERVSPAAPQLDAATQAAAVEILCSTVQQAAVDLADSRNRGVPEYAALHEIQRNSPNEVTREMLTSVVKLVYANNHFSPQTLGVLARQTCQQAWVAQN